MVPCAMFIEPEHLFRGQRIRTCPDVGMVPERECVLYIKLKLVDLVMSKLFCKCGKCFVCRDFAPCNIIIHAADRIVRPVLDEKTGKVGS